MIYGNKYMLFIEERQNARHFIVRPQLYDDYMMILGPGGDTLPEFGYHARSKFQGKAPTIYT